MMKLSDGTCAKIVNGEKPVTIFAKTLHQNSFCNMSEVLQNGVNKKLGHFGTCDGSF